MIFCIRDNNNNQIQIQNQTESPFPLQQSQGDPSCALAGNFQDRLTAYERNMISSPCSLCSLAWYLHLVYGGVTWPGPWLRRLRLATNGNNLPSHNVRGLTKNVNDLTKDDVDKDDDGDETFANVRHANRYLKQVR